MIARNADRRKGTGTGSAARIPATTITKLATAINIGIEVTHYRL
jgi:hypothetical protein